ncbi:c-type cytochrome [Polluticoccus soli]|uniref:c-type cytochrome n=1 Tax=Polluticoccus soli TaxID=3034150 RepID=UPI0023E31DEE|nr:c-type cytochrome [Flavipsychrobacter sp. JY13-12]
MKIRLHSFFSYLLVTLFVFGSCKTYYTPTYNAYVPTPNASVERGKMLVLSSCAGCHLDPNTGKLSGRQFMSTPGIAGKVYTANLTQSTTHSKMTPYNEREFAYLMRTGVARNGHYIPYMPRPYMSDADISAMYAYLHSTDEAVQAHDAVAGLTNLNLIGHMGSILLPKPIPFQASVSGEDPSDAVAYGRYLVYNIGCYECHSKKGPMSIKHKHPEETRGYMAGGRKFKMPDGDIHSSNITMDMTTGIGNYTAEDFRNAVLKNMDKNGKQLRPPMKAFHLLSEKEADAIYAYIKTLPPVNYHAQRKDDAQR